MTSRVRFLASISVDDVIALYAGFVDADVESALGAATSGRVRAKGRKMFSTSLQGYRVGAREVMRTF